MLALASGVVASSQAVPSVFHTGQGLSYGQQDLNWFIGSAANDYTTYATSYFNSNYTNNNFSSASKWLGADSGYQNADVWFTLKIDLTNFDVSTVSFDGFWSSDNGSELYINGSQVGTRAYPGWNDSSGFSIGPSSLVSGMNLLQVKVSNETGPFGARLEFGQVSGEPVPEPFTIALGAAGIGLAMRRRMKKKA